MERIGLYTQVKEFSSANAGTAEWCIAKRGGRKYFIKKFHSPVYPSKGIGLPEKIYAASAAEFKEAVAFREEIYRRLRSCDQSGILVIPEEIISYQFHICTVAEYISANVSSRQVCSLSEWQRLVLLRTLTLALMNVHEAGVVHSDMKPDNVMMTQDAEGNCKLRLIDFDGSFLEEKPPENAEDVAGDPTYFSPEAYRMSMEEGIRIDHRIDIFALGIIFHYFWCGRLPEKPEDQTIGECLLRGGSVRLDESIPPVLKQLILKMIKTDPAERISLKAVYDVLGIQVGLYPPTIVRLQPDSAGKTSETRPAPSPTPPSPAEDAKKMKEVRIDFCDEGGNVLQYRTLKIPYGGKKVIEAEEIAGYHLTGLKTKEITVSSEGYTVSPVTFTYAKNKHDGRKKHVGRNVFLILLSFFAIYWVSMYSLSMQAYREGRHQAARQYMDATPLFAELFPDVYRANLDALNAAGNETAMTAAEAADTAKTVAEAAADAAETAAEAVADAVKTAADAAKAAAEAVVDTAETAAGRESFASTSSTAKTGLNWLTVQVGETKRVKFVAPAAGIYRFTTVGDQDTRGFLYSSASGSTPVRENDDDGDGRNFRIDYTMNANEEIYVGVQFYSLNQSGIITLSIEKIQSANRTFEINDTFRMNKGRVTVSWTDSEDAFPYSVYFLPIGSGEALQSSYWGNGSWEESTTEAKELTLKYLVPGLQYRVCVMDCNDLVVRREFIIPEAPVFSKGYITKKSIGARLAFRQKNDSADADTAIQVNNLRASDIIRDRGIKEYGFLYTVNYPSSAAASYFTQIVITAPNGFTDCEFARDVDYRGYGSWCWYILGNKTFKGIYGMNSDIPTGSWKVDLYWDGMHVNESTFQVY